MEFTQPSGCLLSLDFINSNSLFKFRYEVQQRRYPQSSKLMLRKNENEGENFTGQQIYFHVHHHWFTLCISLSWEGKSLIVKQKHPTLNKQISCYVGSLQATFPSSLLRGIIHTHVDTGNLWWTLWFERQVSVLPLSPCYSEGAASKDLHVPPEWTAVYITLDHLQTEKEVYIDYQTKLLNFQQKKK